MAELERSSKRLKHPGPYLGIVKNTIDSDFQGRLEVALIRGFVDDTDEIPGQFVRVRHVSPFIGNTSVDYNNKGTPNSLADFNGTQKSYGMWMVPPDVGSTVMVFFIEGYLSQGYWFGCVSDKYTNQMIPGIASSTLPASALTQDEQKFYGTDPQDPSRRSFYLPVAEINKNLNVKTENYPPVHTPFAQQLSLQGLLYDRVRGASSSSARRESPSAVFGISTPGPLDVTSNAYQTRNEKYGGESLAPQKLPASRLGGNQFVMDDGDLNGENELIRLRTRNGIQILLHNTQDLVYITNSGGTAWIEMTSQGKIDIFAEDSVSIHTEADFNLRADRNFNIEAGQNVNIKAFKDLNIDVSGGLSALVAKDITLTSAGQYSLSATGPILATTTGEVGLTGSAVNQTAPSINLNGAVKANSLDLGGASAATQVTTVAAAIPLNRVPYNSSGAGWGNNSQYAASSLATTMLRVPVHEPWTEHESNNPVKYSSANTNNTPGASSSADPTVVQPLSVPLAPAIQGEWSPSSNANGSIAFTQGSGDMAHFMEAQPGLRKAIQQAADTYFAARGKPLVISSSYRSQQEQQALYDRWIAAGGGPTRPTVAGITTPVNPKTGTGTHTKGLACDTPQAPELYSMGILAHCGLAWPLGYRDKVHLVLTGASSTE
jgi:LAS superfamily LD-carboxypeptidase LdcB